MYDSIKDRKGDIDNQKRFFPELKSSIIENLAPVICFSSYSGKEQIEHTLTVTGELIFFSSAIQ